MTESLPLLPRIVSDSLIMIVVLILIHGKVGDSTILSWLVLLGRFRFLPKDAVWRPEGGTDQEGRAWLGPGLLDSSP